MYEQMYYHLILETITSMDFAPIVKTTDGRRCLPSVVTHPKSGFITKWHFDLKTGTYIVTQPGDRRELSIIRNHKGELDPLWGMIQKVPLA